jgi:hypothetical protein
LTKIAPAPDQGASLDLAVRLRITPRADARGDPWRQSSSRGAGRPHPDRVSCLGGREESAAWKGPAAADYDDVSPLAPARGTDCRGRPGLRIHLDRVHPHRVTNRSHSRCWVRACLRDHCSSAGSRPVTFASLAASLFVGDRLAVPPAAVFGPDRPPPASRIRRRVHGDPGAELDHRTAAGGLAGLATHAGASPRPAAKAAGAGNVPT